MPPARLRAEERGEERDVLAPLGERRDADREHLQAVEEVLAEPALRDRLLQVGVGRGDEPHVRAQRPITSGARSGARTGVVGSAPARSRWRARTRSTSGARWRAKVSAHARSSSEKKPCPTRFWR